MIRLALVALVALSASSLVSAAPGDVSIAKPSVACPQTQLGDEALQSQYDGLWKAYGEKVAAASKATEEELTRLYEVAKSAGNLDLALFWNGMKKSFADTGQLRWEPAKQKKDWKRFGDAEFPEGLTGILSKCDAGFDKAKDALEEGYKTLEVALTKADKLEQALSIRKEFAALWGAVPSPPPDPPKPDPGKTSVNLLDGLDVEAGRSHDCWKMVGACLHCSGDGPISTSFNFQNPQIERLALKGEYDLTFQIQLLPGAEKNDGEVFIRLPGIAASPSLALRHYAKKTPPASVDFYGPFLDGRNQPNIRIPSPVVWDGRKKTSVKVKVRRKGSSVTILFNGHAMIDCNEFPSQPSSENLRFNAVMNAKVTICDLVISEPKN